MSVASGMAAALAFRLAGITIPNGYQTDIGVKVFRGKPRIAQSDVPCIVIYEAGDKVSDDAQSPTLGRTMGKLADVKLMQRYYIEGHTTCDPDNPNDAAHLILSDLKRAVFGGDRSYGSIARKLTYVGRAIGRREDGLALISASIVIDAEIVENLAEP